MLEELEEDAAPMQRCEDKRKGWARHWQCDSEAQKRLERAARSYKAATGVGCDGFHPQVPVDLPRETTGRIVEFFEQVEQCGRWPQQACTTMFFMIPKHVTSERPIAFLL